MNVSTVSGTITKTNTDSTLLRKKCSTFSIAPAKRGGSGWTTKSDPNPRSIPTEVLLVVSRQYNNHLRFLINWHFRSFSFIPVNTSKVNKDSYYCDRNLLLSLVFDAKVTEWFANPSTTHKEKGWVVKSFSSTTRRLNYTKHHERPHVCVYLITLSPCNST